MTQIGNQVCGRKLKKDDIWAFGFVNFPKKIKDVENIFVTVVQIL